MTFMVACVMGGSALGYSVQNPKTIDPSSDPSVDPSIHPFVLACAVRRVPFAMVLTVILKARKREGHQRRPAHVPLDLPTAPDQ